MKIRSAVLLFPLLSALSNSGNAQELLILSDAEIDQLAILFAPVANSEQQIGSRFPATVVTSPNANSSINSSYAGTLVEWLVNPGDKIGAGTAIARIRSNELLNLENEWLSQASELELARFELERDEKLFSQGIVSAQRLQQTRRRFQQAEIDYNGRSALLRTAGFDEQALAALRDSRLASGIYEVRSPADGILTYRAYLTGEIVAAQTELASLQQESGLWLAAELPARLAAQLNPGFTLSLEHTGETLRVRQKDLIVDTTTQTIEVLAEFTAPANYLPGQIVTLLLPPQGRGVIIPAEAVVHSGTETAVYLRTREGVEVRNLSLEPAGAHYLARAGISPGEQVAVQGTAVLKGMQLGLGQSE